jgi:hypothetical protein
MLYHKFMAYRVTSRARIRDMKYRKQHPVLSITTLSSLGLCATAIYASLGVWDSNGGWMDREQSGGVSWEFTAEIPPEGDPAFRQAEREASLGSLAAIEGDGWRQWSAPVDLLGQWQSSGLDGLSNIGSLQVEFEQAEQQERQQQEVTLEQSPSQKPAVAELAG